MPQCQSPVFCYFCVSEKLHRKYSRNWTKQKPKFLFSPTQDGVQSRDGGGPEGGRTTPWCGPPPGRVGAWCGPLVHLLTSPFCLYILLDEKTLRPELFSRKHTASHRHHWREIGGSRSSSQHPTGEGNHHQRPSSSPCLPPEWCVSSLPWTTGP
jgi:hypothetical protein